MPDELKAEVHWFDYLSAIDNGKKAVAARRLTALRECGTRVVAIYEMPSDDDHDQDLGRAQLWRDLMAGVEAAVVSDSPRELEFKYGDARAW